MVFWGDTKYYSKFGRNFDYVADEPLQYNHQEHADLQMMFILTCSTHLLQKFKMKIQISVGVAIRRCRTLDEMIEDVIFHF